METGAQESTFKGGQAVPGFTINTSSHLSCRIVPERLQKQSVGSILSICVLWAGVWPTHLGDTPGPCKQPLGSLRLWAPVQPMCSERATPISRRWGRGDRGQEPCEPSSG